MFKIGIQATLPAAVVHASRSVWKQRQNAGPLVIHVSFAWGRGLWRWEMPLYQRLFGKVFLGGIALMSAVSLK